MLHVTLFSGDIILKFILMGPLKVFQLPSVGGCYVLDFLFDSHVDDTKKKKKKKKKIIKD